MKSVASTIRSSVAHKPIRSFISPSDFEGSTRAIESELSRLAARGELEHVRKGLYWKGPKTELGMVPPHPFDIALKIGGPGTGPAGFSAAAMLGLTTQVPATVEVAVPGGGGWMPMAPAGVHFTRRHVSRREIRLRPAEVALIEVLRDWPVTVESSWEDLVARSREFVTTGDIRPKVVTKGVEATHRRGVRDAWRRLEADLGA
jgi:hypothetical protein